MSEHSDRRTVLLVDDDAGVRTTLARYLEFEGFAILEAGNGEEALTQVRTERAVAAIVLDLRMPVMDGWTFRRVQRDDPAIAGIPVIVLSGADAQRVAELDVVAVFEKPVRMSQIADQLRLLVAAPNEVVRSANTPSDSNVA
jgi:CheY-like chemotaxis protein